MFIVAIWMIAGGYALGYYGTSMWKYYEGDPHGNNGNGIPLAVILGFQSIAQTLTKTGGNTHATPPFNLGGTIYGQTAHTTAAQKTTTTGATPAGGQLT